LCALQPDYLCLQDIVALSQLCVLSLKPIDFRGLRAELGLENLDAPLAVLCLVLQLTLHGSELIVARCTYGVGLRRFGRALAMPPPAVSSSVRATDGTEALALA
jgi:hypothetical protein